MPTMKVTPDAAMRARDVSRPHAGHLEWAEEAEALVTDASIEADVVVKPGVEAEAGGGPARASCPAVAAPAAEAAGEAPAETAVEAAAEAPAEADIPDPESPGSEDRRADAGRVGGTRRRRVRGVRSSSRRGRHSR
jgi:hypothetical protein